MNKIFLIFVFGLLVVSCSAKEENTQLANPASVNCIDMGGTLRMEHNDNGEYGVCVLPDGTECEEWALFRGECGSQSEE